jgi:hypothetical protein
MIFHLGSSNESSRYVLSPTHLHEFKSADKNQAPIMSLYLPEQKLGSHTDGSGSSNKFSLKGRQTGSMHRGHNWILRAESHETMMAWYEDIKTLTEKSPQERDEFVRQHARSVSGTLQRAASVSSDGAMDDDDEEPFSAQSSAIVAKQEATPRRPQPGGRFPSDLQVNTQRGLQAPLSPSSGSSDIGDAPNDSGLAAHADFPGSATGGYGGVPLATAAHNLQPTHAAELNQYAHEDGVNPYTSQPIQTQDDAWYQSPAAMAGAAGLGGAAGVVSTDAYLRQQDTKEAENPEQLQQRAAQEASELAAPDSADDTQHLQDRQRAATEATRVAAPDVDFYDKTPSAGPPIATLESVVTDHPTATSPTSPIGAGASQGNYTTAKADLTSDAYPERAAPGEPQTQNVPNPLETVLRPLTDDLARPALAMGQNHQSEQSISQLHVPGEFPKASDTKVVI